MVAPALALQANSPWHGLPEYSLPLVCSNAVMMPAIVFAVRRRLYVEAVAMVLTMVVSILYHLCQAHVFCMFHFGMLQVADHLAAWTLVVWLAMFYSGWTLEVRVSIMFFANQVLLLGWLSFFESWIFQASLIGLTVALMLAMYLTNRKAMRTNNFHVVDLVMLSLVGGLGFFLFFWGSRSGRETGSVTTFFVDSDYWWAHSMWHFLIFLAALLAVAARVHLTRKDSFARHTFRQMAQLVHDGGRNEPPPATVAISLPQPVTDMLAVMGGGSSKSKQQQKRGVKCSDTDSEDRYGAAAARRQQHHKHKRYYHQPESSSDAEEENDDEEEEETELPVIYENHFNASTAPNTSSSSDSDSSSFLARSH